MTVDLVTSDRIESMWPQIEAGISRALKSSSGESTVEDTKAGLLSGRTRLLMFGEALGVVLMMISFPRYKVARVLLMFGKGIAVAKGALEEAERWAKDQGCSYVEGWVSSASRSRLFGRYGYEPTYLILRKGLA